LIRWKYLCIRYCTNWNTKLFS